MIIQAVNCYLVAAGGGGSWTTVNGPNARTNDSVDWRGYTMRQRLPAAALTDATGTQIRTSIWSQTANGVYVTKSYIGLAGAGTYDFAATPTQLLFGGSASGSAAAGALLTSDGLTFTYTGTSDILISWYFAASPQTDLTFSHVSSAANGYKSGDDAVTVTATGYSATATDNCAIRLLEAFV